MNSEPRSVISVLCFCRGRGCTLCNETGFVDKKSCRRCGGTGTETRIKDVGPKCRDCRGEGWRSIDNEKTWD